MSFPTKFLMPVLPLAIIVLLNWACVQNLDWELRLTASIVVLACWLPFVVHVFTGSRGLPFLPVLALIYGMYYAAPVFLLPRYYVVQLSVVIPDEAILQAERYALLGLICLLVGYYLLPEQSHGWLPRMQLDFERRINLWLMAGVGLLAVAFQNLSGFIHIPLRLAAMADLLMQLASFVIALLFCYHLQGRLSRPCEVLFWGLLLPIKLITSISSGAMFWVIQDLFCLFGAYWVARRRYPWKMALVCTLILVPFLGTKLEFRRRLTDPEAPTDSFSRAQAFAGLVWEGLQGRENFYHDSYLRTIERMGMISTFGLVVDVTPRIVPYWEGQSYNTLLWSFIPRALYPEKPQKTLGQDFGHRYGLLHKRDVTTSYNFPQLVEMYANFGTSGVVLGMFVVGLLYRLLYLMLAHPQAGEGGALLAWVIFARLCNIESDFSLVFGGLVLNVLILAMLLRLFQTRSVHMPMSLVPGRQL